MSDPLKICIQRAETREEWDAMQDDYIDRALAAVARIEQMQDIIARIQYTNLRRDMNIKNRTLEIDAICKEKKNDARGD